MHRLFKAMVFGTALMAAGCLSPGAAGTSAGESVAVTPVLASSVCGETDGPGLVWMEIRTDLLRTLDRFPNPGRNKISDIDFGRFAVLGIFMGRCPTGGYRLALADSRARVQNSTAEVRVDWKTPAPGTMVTQMVTSPCLLVQMEKGGYTRIEVMDREGGARLALDLSQ